MDFVILGTPRTGSKILNYFLQQQNNITTYSELFKKTDDPFLYYCKDDEVRNNIIEKVKLLNLEDINTDAALNKFKFTNPSTVLEILAGEKKKKELIGIKMFFDHFKHILDPSFDIFRYFVKNNTKVILINRKNKFLQYLSLIKAREDEAYNLSRHDIQNALRSNEIKSAFKNLDTQVNLNPLLYKQWKEETINQYIEIEKKLIHHNIPYVKYFYEDIVSIKQEACFREIYNFITGNGKYSCRFVLSKQKYFKQNIFTIPEQIKNFNKVQVKLYRDKDFIAALKMDKKVITSQLNKITSVYNELNDAIERMVSERARLIFDNQLTFDFFKEKPQVIEQSMFDFYTKLRIKPFKHF